MSEIVHWLARSEHPAARFVRKVRRAILNFSLPVPPVLARPVTAGFVAARECYFFLVRVLICEPIFKGYCTQRGKRVRTGVFIHWVQGSGQLVLGDNVLVDGRVSFTFAARYVTNPLLSIGSNTVISNGCSFIVGRQVTIGDDCLIAEGVHIFDSPGHPTDPVRRKAGAPADPDDVRAIAIHDNVWVGRKATVFPGVTIGEGSVVAMGASVVKDVPPYTLVAGDPARVIARLDDHPAEAESPQGLIPLAEFVGTSVAPAEVEKISSQDLHPGHYGAAASLHEVMAILREVLGTADLGPDDDFYDAGVTSIMGLPLLMDLEERFGVTIPDDEFLDSRTGQQLATRIERLSAHPNAQRANA